MATQRYNIPKALIPFIYIILQTHTSTNKYVAANHTVLSNLFGLAGHKVARIEVPKPPRRWGVGRGCPTPHWGMGLERGQCPSPEKNFDFVSLKWRVLVHSWCKITTSKL